MLVLCCANAVHMNNNVICLDNAYNVDFPITRSSKETDRKIQVGHSDLVE